MVVALTDLLALAACFRSFALGPARSKPSPWLTPRRHTGHGRSPATTTRERLDAGHARTYPVGMNLTLSIDEALAERARAVAAGRGKSLNQLVRDLLEAETGIHDGAARARVLDELWATSTGHSGGVRIRREDAYEGRLK